MSQQQQHYAPGCDSYTKFGQPIALNQAGSHLGAVGQPPAAKQLDTRHPGSSFMSPSELHYASQQQPLSLPTSAAYLSAAAAMSSFKQTSSFANDMRFGKENNSVASYAVAQAENSALRALVNRQTNW